MECLDGSAAWHSLRNMIDWAKIHAAEIAPTLAKFAAPPPPAVLILLLVVFLGGLALIIWSPAKFKAAGFVLIGITLFIAYMTAGNYYRAKHRLARYERGIIEKKFSRKSTRKDSRGQILPVTTYFIEISIDESRKLGSKGAAEPTTAYNGKRERLVAESLYNKVTAGEKVHAVILPTAKDAIHFVVRDNGEIIK